MAVKDMPIRAFTDDVTQHLLEDSDKPSPGIALLLAHEQGSDRRHACPGGAFSAGELSSSASEGVGATSTGSPASAESMTRAHRVALASSPHSAQSTKKPIGGPMGNRACRRGHVLSLSATTSRRCKFRVHDLRGRCLDKNGHDFRPSPHQVYCREVR